MSAQKDNSSNLFEYSDDWQKKFLAPEVVLTKYNFKLIANLQGQGIFTFPLFSKNFCNQLIKKLKKFDNWTTNRHEHYPTNDVLIEDFDMEFAKMYNTVLCDILLTAVHDLYEFPYPDPDMFDHETFIIRYKPEIRYPKIRYPKIKYHKKKKKIMPILPGETLKIPKPEKMKFVSPK